jgi:hypothetical protein
MIERPRFAQRAAAATLVVVLLGLALACQSALGAYPKQTPTFIYRSTSQGVSDSFYSYDTNAPPHATRGYKDLLPEHRDWPIMIIWRGEASKYRIKHGLGTLKNPNNGAALHFETRGHINYEPYQILHDGKTKPRYNGTKGQKDRCGEYPNKADTPRDIHVRFAGESRSSDKTQRLYDPTGKDPNDPTNEALDKGWNWFVVSSVHYDYGEDTDPAAPNDCNGYGVKWGGYSEKATNQLAALVDTINNSPSDPFGKIVANKFPTHNREGPRDHPFAPHPDDQNRPEGNHNHIWQSDGRAHVITVNK